MRLSRALLRARRACLCLAVLLLASAAVQSAFLKPMDRHSYAQIEQAYTGLPLMVALWSLDCPPCIKELRLLGQLKQQYPDFNLVLINTDGLEAATEAEVMLTSFDLSGADAWVFASEPAEVLRFSIDPQWYGELPRSYVYHAGERQGSSGLIEEARLRRWLNSVATADKPQQ